MRTLRFENKIKQRIDTIKFNPRSQEPYRNPKKDKDGNEKKSAKPFRESFRVALGEYKEEYGLNNSDLSRELGVGSTQISKYLNEAPEGDVVELERRIGDVIMVAPLRRATADELYETSVTKAVAARCEVIRKTNDVGLIHGPAGIGKSSGIDLYAAANATCIFVRLSKWSGYAGGVEMALYDEIETRDKPHRIKRAPWMVERFKGSNRLIIVDNAQRLTKGGLEWLFDFHDAMKCPIAMVGNPEVLTKIKRNDQQFSRIGNARKVVLKKPTEAASNMLANVCPEDAEALRPLAAKIAAHKGHLRALRKHLLLMPELIDAANGDPVMAFKMAHTQLVNDCDLSDV